MVRFIVNHWPAPPGLSSRLSGAQQGVHDPLPVGAIRSITGRGLDVNAFVAQILPILEACVPVGKGDIRAAAAVEVISD
jgi:hypothetical protein